MTTPQHAWGLELTLDRVVLVRVTRTGGRDEVDRCHTADLPTDWEPGAPPPWAAAVRGLAIQRDTCDPLVVTVSDDLLLYRTLTLPAADDEMLGKMVATQAEAVLPEPDLLEWSWGKLGRDSGGDRVMVCAIRRDVRRAAMEAAAVLGTPRLVVPAASVPKPAALNFAPDIARDATVPAPAAALMILTATQPSVILPVEAPSDRIDSARPSGKPLRDRRLLIAAAWAIAALLGLYALDVHQAGRLEAAVEKLRAASAPGGGLEQQLRLGRYLEQTPTPPLPMLDELSRLIPQMVVLTGLEYDSTGQLRLQGYMMGGGGLDALVQKLAESPLLDTVSLRSATLNPQTRQWNFEVTAQAAPIFKYLGHKATAPPVPPPAPTPTPPNPALPGAAVEVIE